MNWFDRGERDELRSALRAASDELDRLRQHVALLGRAIDAIPSSVVVIDRHGSVMRRDEYVGVSSHEHVLLDEAVEVLSRRALDGVPEIGRAHV